MGIVTSKLNLIWANKPDCNRVVAEVWIDREHLWCTLFIDDNDNRLKIEVLPSCDKTTTFVVDFIEAERLIDAAKRDLLAMSGPLG